MSPATWCRRCRVRTPLTGEIRVRTSPSGLTRARGYCGTCGLSLQAFIWGER